MSRVRVSLRGTHAVHAQAAGVLSEQQELAQKKLNLRVGSLASKKLAES